MKKIIILISISAMGLILVLSYFLWNIHNYGLTPLNTDQRLKDITILKGENFSTVLDKLLDGGIINQPVKFKILARLKKYDKKIKAGDYRFSPSMTPVKILKIMKKGEVSFYKVTIPEGYNLKQIASVIAESGLVDQKKFIKLSTDPSYVREKKIAAETFEGYLFPDTYFFAKTAPCEEIFSIMLKRFQSKITTEMRNRAKNMNMSIHQVITIASIIEKETGAPFERPVISSVFHNRLKKGMRLQSDPTVIYGIKRFDGNITKKNLKTATPYNTYVIKGLPPGPIANPGIESIKAALYPAETDFLFFVSKKNRTHKFSINIRDHNKAVRKYQLKRSTKK